MKGISGGSSSSMIIRSLMTWHRASSYRWISSSSGLLFNKTPTIEAKALLSPPQSTAPPPPPPPQTTSLSPSLQVHRTLCSPASGSWNIIPVESEQVFNTAMKKIQEMSLPAIVYFTAVWCGPCKFIAPILKELSGKYPDVTIYKIDIDQEGLGNTLSRLFVTAVPTFHFYLNGKKTDEIVGADVQRLKENMEELYGKD